MFASYLREHARPLVLAPIACVFVVLGILYIPRLVSWIVGLIVAGVTALVAQLILPTGLLIRDTLGLGIFLLLGVVLLALAAYSLEDRLRLRPSLTWHQWTALVLLIPFAFGFLSFLALPGFPDSLERGGAGGTFGRAIVGQPDGWGIGRLALLAIAIFALYDPVRARCLGLLGLRGGLLVIRRTWRWFVQVVLAFGTGDAASETVAHVDPGPAPDLDVQTYSSPEVTTTVRATKPAAVRRVKERVVAARPSSGAGGAWKLPPLDLLDKMDPEGRPLDNGQRVKLIEEKLREYGVDGRVIEVNQGPAVTQFGIEPGWVVKKRAVKERDEDGRIKYDKDGRPRLHLEEISRTRVKVNKITALSNDLALALAVPSVRIEAPVPGKPLVGIEVPNTSTAVVGLRRVIESNAFQKVGARSKLALALGQGVEGQPMAADLAKMPHLLIAGATGSGKSVCINSIIANLLMHATPDEVRFIMVDPKRVELVPFNGIPHLLAPVVVDAEKVTGVLKWVVHEMDARYKKFAATGARNIEAYNKRLTTGEKAMPYWVVIIDELADLMMVAADDVERMLCRLAQLARATGIHLIVATQRPSVDVVTGLIKANFPTRISFAVTSQIDSRTILDMGGAEKLLGRGDMLYMGSDAAKPVRLQGTLVGDSEVERLVGYWVSTLTPAGWGLNQETPDFEALQEEDRRDPLLVEAKKLLAQHGRVSASLLQRRLRVGYVRASRLVELLEEDGLLGDEDTERSDEYFD